MKDLVRLTPSTLLLAATLALMAYTVYALYGVPYACVACLAWLSFALYAVGHAWWADVQELRTVRGRRP